MAPEESFLREREPGGRSGVVSAVAMQRGNARQAGDLLGSSVGRLPAYVPETTMEWG